MPAGHKRRSRNLAIKFLRPAARERRVASRATAFWSQLVLFDQISIAPDQHFAALMAMSIFQILHPPGKVAGVDVAQPSFTTDGGGAQQIFGTRIGGGGRFCCLVW